MTIKKIIKDTAITMIGAAVVSIYTSAKAADFDHTKGDPQEKR